MFFCGEVGVEDVGEVFGGDAGAGVGDVEDDFFFGGDGSDEEFAAGVHRLDGIE